MLRHISEYHFCAHVPEANAGVLNFLLAYPPAVLPMPRRRFVPVTLEVGSCCSFELLEASLVGRDCGFEDESGIRAGGARSGSASDGSEVKSMTGDEG